MRTTVQLQSVVPCSLPAVCQWSPTTHRVYSAYVWLDTLSTITLHCQLLQFLLIAHSLKINHRPTINDLPLILNEQQYFTDIFARDTLSYFNYSVVHLQHYPCNYTMSRPLRLIWHNCTNSQHLLIIFGRERPYSILNWHDKVFKLA